MNNNSMVPEWLDLGPVNQIPLRGARTVPVMGGPEIAVFRTGDDRVYALENSCPHKRGPLSQGIVHGDRVTCPLHNWTISLASGQAQGEGQRLHSDDPGCASFPGRVLIARAAVIKQAEAA
jgi:nitrite reductase (NADH) small subunit